MRTGIGNRSSIAQLDIRVNALADGDGCSETLARARQFHHVFELARLDIPQTDVFHKFLLISCDSVSRSSSFCYQIVVREIENRQLLHFF